jgi:hypothetical protein
MNRSALRRIVLLFSLLIPTIFAGCDRPAANGKPAATAKSSPEDRYNNIMDSFRRKIDGQPVGFVVTDNGSRSMMVGSSKVTSELIRPDTPDGHFKAVVTVTTETRYSLRRAPKSAEETDREKNSKNQNSSALTDKDKQGVGILEPDLTPSRGENPQAAPKPKQPEEDTVTRRTPPPDVRKYKLVDDGEQWVLITKLDPKTEASIQFAFNEALAHQ